MRLSQRRPAKARRQRKHVCSLDRCMLLTQIKYDSRYRFIPIAAHISFYVTSVIIPSASPFRQLRQGLYKCQRIGKQTEIAK